MEGNRCLDCITLPILPPLLITGKNHPSSKYLLRTIQDLFGGRLENIPLLLQSASEFGNGLPHKRNLNHEIAAAQPTLIATRRFRDDTWMMLQTMFRVNQHCLH